MSSYTIRHKFQDQYMENTHSATKDNKCGNERKIFSNLILLYKSVISWI